MYARHATRNGYLAHFLAIQTHKQNLYDIAAQRAYTKIPFV